MSRLKRYTTASGGDPIDSFLKGLPPETRAEIFTLLRRLELGELLSMPHSRSMGTLAAGLYELRVRDKAGQVRVFYYTKVRNTIYLIHALRKKGRTIPDKDRKLILKRLREIKET